MMNPRNDEAVPGTDGPDAQMQILFSNRNTDWSHLRNADGRSGSCLSLWKRSTIKDALYETLTRPSYPRRYGIEVKPSGVIRTSTLDPDEVAQLRRRQAAGGAGAGNHRVDPVRDAWIEMLLPHFSEADCCFFTGTYSDAYGYPNGMMKPDNVLRDWRRFLKKHHLEHTDWVVCAEPHQERAIWHVHALLADCDKKMRQMLKADWGATRGGADAPRLHDGGVNYATKYALKSGESIMFDWCLT